MAAAAAAAVNRHGSAGRMEGVSRQSRVGPGGAVKVLECGVCEDVFTLQGDKVPRLLLCGHTVCHDCLTRLPLHGRAIRCPFDRQVTELGDSGVWGLKKNFALLELLERLQNGASGQSGSTEESVGGYGEGTTASSSEKVNSSTTRSVREDEYDYVLHIHNELLIQLVEARPPLWDKSHPQHADNFVTRRLWDEIYPQLVRSWDSRSRRIRKICKKQIQTRWRSIRDRFTRCLNEDRRAPGSSPGTRRTTYRYQSILQFLRRTVNHRQRTPRRIESEVVQEEVTSTGSAVHCVSSRAIEAALPGPSSTSLPPTGSVAMAFWEHVKRMRTGRRYSREIENFAVVTFEGLRRVEDTLSQMKNDIRLRLEERNRLNSMSADHNFLLTLLPWMEQMTPQQQYECRLQLTSTVWNILHPPQSQSYPTPQSHCPSNAFHPTHAHTPSPYNPTPQHSYFQSHSVPDHHQPPSQLPPSP